MEKFKPFIIPVALLVLIDQMVKIVISKVFMKYEFDIIAKVLRFYVTKYSFILCWQFLRIIIKSVCYHFIECVCFVPLFIRIYAISGKKSTYKFLGKNDNDLWHIGMFM